MGFKSAVTKRASCALRCRSTPCLVYQSILSLQYRPIVDLDGHLVCLLQISLKCSKIINYLQNIPDLINIINKLYNNINISKNTYKLWMKIGQIHSLSRGTHISWDWMEKHSESWQSLWYTIYSYKRYSNFSFERSCWQ